MPAPRMTRRGITYMPSSYQACRKGDFIRLLPAISPSDRISGPVGVFMQCVCCTAASYTKNERMAALEGRVHCKVGAPDNLGELVLDAPTDAGAWIDGKQVDELTLRKRYGERDEIRVRIEVRPAA